jgi:heme O synthase-like polyprenyltransferase
VTILSAAISWSAVMALLYLAAYTLLMSVAQADPMYAAFSVAFGACALWLSVKLFQDGTR